MLHDTINIYMGSVFSLGQCDSCLGYATGPLTACNIAILTLSDVKNFVEIQFNTMTNSVVKALYIIAALVVEHMIVKLWLQ